jgi:epoxyqueuosine reductase
MTSISETLLKILGPRPCCGLAAVPVSGLAERERKFFAAEMPFARSAVVLAHHVTTIEEWRWYALENGGERCAADDHAGEVLRLIRGELLRAGQQTEIVKYPEQSGLQFRSVAQAAGFGRIGVNAFLFHPQWGPWVHLRVLAAGAELDIRPAADGGQFCNRCMLCVPACPAGAISEEGFAGQTCRAYRKAKGEYEPYGPERELRYCLLCALNCPRGTMPRLR